MDRDTRRETLTRLMQTTGKEAVSLAEAARIVGKDARTLKKMKGFPMEENNGRYIVKLPRLAAWLN